MKKLYLYTKSEGRINGPIQKPMAEGEIRALYVDNEHVATVRAVPSNVRTCSGCYLKTLNRMNMKVCTIPIESVGDTAIGGVCCGYEKLILENIEELLEDL